MTEKLLSVRGMKYNCVNTKNGCQEVLVETDLEVHESGCIYRVVPCLKNALWPRNPCLEKVTFQEIIQHYEGHRKAELKEKDLEIKHRMKCRELVLSGDSCFSSPAKFSLNNQTFLLLRKTEEKIVYFWVYMLGSPNEAKHFSCTLKLFGPKSTLTTEQKVAAIDESFNTLSKAGKCFAYALKMFVAQFSDEERKFEYSLRIRNLKEEVKDENYESGISDNNEDGLH